MTLKDIKSIPVIDYLAMLQVRLGVHGTRLWQLPFTYIGILVVAMTLSSDESIVDLDIIMWFLSIIGTVVLFCMLGAREGYKRTVKHMAEMENSINDTPTTMSHKLHIIPYLLLQAISITTAILLALGLNS